MLRLETNPFFIRVEPPITSKQLSTINEKVGRVQFSAALTERDHKKLAQHLRQFPEIHVRAYELFGSPERNLDFLKHYKGLKRLCVHLEQLESINGIHHVADTLEYFEFGKTKRKFDLGFLTHCSRLKSLHLDNHSEGLEIISKLEALEALSLRSITLLHLEVVASPPKLMSLRILLGGTKNLSALSHVKFLKHLELYMVKGLSDITVISEIPSLQNIFLGCLRNVTAIPMLDKLQKLRRWSFQKMTSIKDLSPLLKARSLEDASFTCASHLKPEDFLPLTKHPALKSIGFGLGSNKKNNAVAAMFPNLTHTIKYPFIYR